MFSNLITLYSELLQHNAILRELKLTETGDGSLQLKINDVYIYDKPGKVIRTENNPMCILWDNIEPNIVYDDEGSVDYAAINIYKDNNLIGEILL